MWTSFLGNEPIRIWGKVTDIHGVSLEGVKVSYRLSKPRFMWDTNTRGRTVVTDADGEFSIDERGSGFDFEAFEKEGYRMTKGIINSFSEDEKYSIENPQIFTLIKEDQIADLIKSDITLLLDWDGVPVFYDLKTGKLGETGEIKITALRENITGEGREARYDWSFKIEVPGGGIVETTREAAFLAPETGYKPSWEYGYMLSDPEWSIARGNDTFLFFKLGNGDYGKLIFYFNARLGKKITGSITSYLNPAGTRILEGR